MSNYIKYLQCLLRIRQQIVRSESQVESRNFVGNQTKYRAEEQIKDLICEISTAAADADGQLSDDQAIQLIDALTELRKGYVSSPRVNFILKDLEATLPANTQGRKLSLYRSRYGKSRRSASVPQRTRDLTFGYHAKLIPAVTKAISAVMQVLEGETLKRCICTLSIKEIGDLSGLSRSSVQLALRKLRDAKLISVTVRRMPRQRNMTNVISISSNDWIDFFKVYLPSRIKFQATPALRSLWSGLKNLVGNMSLINIKKAQLTEILAWTTKKQELTYHYRN